MRAVTRSKKEGRKGKDAPRRRQDRVYERNQKEKRTKEDGKEKTGKERSPRMGQRRNTKGRKG